MPDKRGRGRPPIGPEIKVALRTDQIQWLEAKEKPKAETIRELIDEAKAKDEQ
jgi:hypothetical protein